MIHSCTCSTNRYIVPVLGAVAGIKKRPEQSNTSWSSEIRRTTKLIQNQAINHTIYVNLETWCSPFKQQRVATRKAWGQEVTESSLVRDGTYCAQSNFNCYEYNRP